MLGCCLTLHAAAALHCAAQLLEFISRRGWSNRVRCAATITSLLLCARDGSPAAYAVRQPRRTA